MPQYQIRSGDTLSKIAQQFGYGGDYMSIARANGIANPNLIQAGATLNIPDRSAPGQAPASAPAPVQQPQQQVQSGGGVPPVDMSKYAGWNDQAAIQADWNNTWQSKTGGGASSSFSMPQGPAIPNFQAIYDKSIQEATNTFAPQITEAQAGVDLVNKQIATRTEALNAALAKINDNPYYSEATRVGRARKLQEAYNNDVALLNSQLGIASNKLTNTQNLAEKAKADAQIKINIASQQYNIENQQYQQNLQQINSYLSAGMFNNATGADIAQIATSTGMSTSMVQSIIDYSKKKNEVKPELQAVSDDTGQYLVAVQTTPEGLKILNREKIGEAPKKEKSGTGSNDKEEKAFDDAISEGIKQLQNGENWETVWRRIKSRFPDVPDMLIDTGLGTQWRQPGAYQNWKAITKPPKEEKSLIIPGGT